MILTDAILLLILAFSAASLTNFIDDCIAPEMIFSKYGEWVRSLGYVGKPIGGCIICTNVWVSAAVYFAAVLPCSLYGYLLAILFISVSNTILKFIIR
jgi:hypothetical protein